MNEVVSPVFNFGSQYLYAHLLKANHFYIEKFENYQKRSERNKYNIINHLGIQTLTIPLKSGKNNQHIITDVKISYDENWQKFHLKCIESAYRKAPFYEYYMDQISLLFHKKHEFLWDFNTEVVTSILKILKSDKSVRFTKNFQKSYPERVIDLRKPYSVDLNSFHFYNQVFEDRLPFIPNASILDSLFCLGPRCKQYLENLVFE
jgi:hypothetical protein